MRRIALALAVLATCLVALAPAAAARTRIGSDYLVRPGQTITFSGMNLSAGNTLLAGANVQGAGFIPALLFGDNAGFQGGSVDLPDFSFTNDTDVDLTLRLWITDFQCGGTSYFADGDHALVTNKAAALNDAGPGCALFSLPNTPDRVKGVPVGNFVARISIG